MSENPKALFLFFCVVLFSSFLSIFVTMSESWKHQFKSQSLVEKQG